MRASVNPKAAVRLAMRQRLGALGAEERAERSRRIIHHLVALPQWRAATRVLLFAPLVSEPDVDTLWATGQLANKLCFYPRVNGARLDLCRVSKLDQLEAGPWSLRQPAHSAKPAAPASMDLVLVPGLAFTRAGKRLGRGGGFYDRFLVEPGGGALTIGIAFAFQLVRDLPTEPHDVSVDQVITDLPLDRRPTPGDQLDQDHDNGDHEQNVNEPANGASADKTEQPKDN